jgi:hypothetical protein
MEIGGWLGAWASRFLASRSERRPLAHLVPRPPDVTATAPEEKQPTGAALPVGKPLSLAPDPHGHSAASPPPRSRMPAGTAIAAVAGRCQRHLCRCATSSAACGRSWRRRTPAIGSPRSCSRQRSRRAPSAQSSLKFDWTSRVRLGADTLSRGGIAEATTIIDTAVSAKCPRR